MRFIGRQISISFFNGLLVLLPIVLTIYLLNYAYQLLNEWGLNWLSALIPNAWHFPGNGIVFIFLFVCIVGIFARMWFTKLLLNWMEVIIARIPVVKGLYGVLRETMQSFFGEKKSFDTVVFVNVNGSKRMGFLTVKEAHFATKDGKKYVGVYFPQSLQVSGDLHWYEEQNVEVLDMGVDEALQLIISAGVAAKK